METRIVKQDVTFLVTLDRAIEADIDFTGDPSIDDANATKALQREIEFIQREIQDALCTAGADSIVTGRPYKLVAKLAER